MAAITPDANIRLYSTSTLVQKDAITTTSVRALSELVIRVVMKNSFQELKKTKIDDATSPGADKGKTILKKLPNLEQPSIIAASSKSLGIILKYSLSIQIAKGNNQDEWAKITP